MNLRSIISCLSLIICTSFSIFGQISIEGYTFESGNRGYLSQVLITAEDAKSGDFIKQITSDNDGKFVIEVPPGISSVKLKGSKDLFHEIDLIVGPQDVNAGKAFVKMQLKRAPGYIFEITLSEKSDSIGSPTNHIRNALIEVYNNTTEKPIIVLDDHPHPDFKVDLAKGNHYTVMIRKKGYLAKRMEAFVDVEGCILCFEGIGDVRPDVSDNLSGGNTMGTLLANVELEPLFEGKSIELQNIYYDLGKADIRPDAALELDKAAIFLNDNPQITVELGSHTDSRGKKDDNMDLSVRRAQSAVEYLVKNGDVEAFRINPRGYGEGSPAIKCGTECTEDEYARNRRSEIKILGIAAGIPYKSLEKIKYEENFDKMILALQEEGQVKVPEDGDIPDEIKNSPLNTKSTSAENMEGSVEGVTEKVIPNVETNKIIEEKVIEQTIQEVPAQQMEKEVIEKVIEVEQMKSVSDKVKAVENEKEKGLEKGLEKEVAVIQTSTEKEMTQKVTEVEDEKRVMTEKVKTATSATDILSSYTGHKIVVAFRRIPLDSDDALYSSFPDLSVYKAKAGYFLYMTGDFEAKSDAEARVLALKDDNPNVYVVEFDNGNRVN